MKRFKGQAGMSLVEVTIILLVLMLLTGVLAPSIIDLKVDAQMVKVKEDCEAIGVTVARLTRDVGPCLYMTQVPGPDCTMANRADILYSDGPWPLNPAQDLGGLAATPSPVGTGSLTTSWLGPNVSPMVSQFTTNQDAALMQIYPTPNNAAFLWTYPSMGLGWRGAYLPSPIGPDPWGRVYMVNSAFLAPAVDFIGTPPSEALPGQLGWNRDVFCISGGPNQTFETAFGGEGPAAGVWNGGVFRGGDDFIYVISGATR